MKRRLIGILLTVVLVLSACSRGQTDNTVNTVNTDNTDKTNKNAAVTSDNKVSSTSVEDIIARLTLDQKAAQMGAYL